MFLSEGCLRLWQLQIETCTSGSWEIFWPWHYTWKKTKEKCSKRWNSFTLNSVFLLKTLTFFMTSHTKVRDFKRKYLSVKASGKIFLNKPCGLLRDILKFYFFLSEIFLLKNNGILPLTGHYIKWSKSNRERHIVHIIYMWNLKTTEN